MGAGHFHLAELYESYNKIIDLINQLLVLNKNRSNNINKISRIILDIEVELYYHSCDHIKKLKRPLIKFAKKICNDK